MNTSCSDRWYALQTQLRTEQLVSAQLRSAGIQEYLPHNLQREPSRRKSRQQPLFPGYVFCRINLASGPKLYKIRYVVRIAGNGKQPTPIDDIEIDSIRKLLISTKPVESMPSLVAGDRITVTQGPFAGISGVLLTVENIHKLVVCLPLLNRSVAVTLPAGSVTAMARVERLNVSEHQ